MLQKQPAGETETLTVPAECIPSIRQVVAGSDAARSGAVCWSRTPVRPEGRVPALEQEA